jgi:predicted amidohydrolase
MIKENELVRVAAVQMSMDVSPQVNYEKSLDYIRQAAKAGARFVCFPEGQLTHYLPQYPGLTASDFAVPFDHPYIKGFCNICRSENIIASVALNLSIDGKIYPSNMIISETGEILGVGKKNHIVRAPHFYEQDYFTPGQDGFTVVTTSIGRIGSVVCFDRHYPESFRTCTLKGADFIIVPVANEETEPTEIFQWEMRIAAFQNSTNIVMCNRVGREGNMDFNGHTVFVKADGTVAALADNREQLLVTELDLKAAPHIRAEK